MSGVFLSYSRADRALADQVVRSLRALGVETWWDEDMHGVDWQEELEHQISALGAIVVLWTENSSGSKNVRDEARLGLEGDSLVNAVCGIKKPPFPFDRINALPLDGWNGREPHRGWTRLVATVEELMVRKGEAEVGAITGALAAREAELRAKRQAVSEAQEAFRDAQTREAETDEAAKAADAAFAAAEEQFRQVVEMRAAPTLLGAAQQHLDAVRAAKDAADEAHRAARADLSAASRKAPQAQRALDSLFADSAEPVATPLAAPAEAAAAAIVAAPAPQAPPTAPKPGPATPSRAVLWLAGAGVLAVIVVGVLLAHPFTPAPKPAAPTPPAAPPAAVQAPAPAVSPPAPVALTGPVRSLAGLWTSKHADGKVFGLSCTDTACVHMGDSLTIDTSERYTSSVDGDSLTVRMQDEPPATFHIADPDTLTETVGGKVGALHRCAGDDLRACVLAAEAGG